MNSIASRCVLRVEVRGGRNMECRRSLRVLSLMLTCIFAGCSSMEDTHHETDPGAPSNVATSETRGLARASGEMWVAIGTFNYREIPPGDIDAVLAKRNIKWGSHGS